jgi:hypothetical protein
VANALANEETQRLRGQLEQGSTVLCEEWRKKLNLLSSVNKKGDQSFPPSLSFFSASIPPVLFGFNSTDRS